MKIAFLHKALIFGGAERLILDMALASGQLGHQSTFYTCNYNSKRTFEEFSNSKSITVKVSVH